MKQDSKQYRKLQAKHGRVGGKAKNPKKGFGSMDKELVRALASKGGKASSETRKTRKVVAQ